MALLEVLKEEPEGLKEEAVGLFAEGVWSEKETALAERPTEDPEGLKEEAVGLKAEGVEPVQSGRPPGFVTLSPDTGGGAWDTGG